jgi:hypothetical protein
MTRYLLLGLMFGIGTFAGCSPVESTPSAGNSGQGIVGKTTQEVGAFDPNQANQVVSNQKINAQDPVTGPLAAYGPMVESLAKTQITHALGIFNATEGRYPANHEEFMERIIKENNIQLPKLPYQGKYMYDVEKHELVIVRDIENAAKAAGQ